MVAAFVLSTGLCLWAKPWHMDEPFFLAIARQIIRDPFHPLAFDFNWYGSAVPMGTINNTPPLLAYLLAGALKLTGGSEFWTRALFFPFDLAAAWGLLALAGRFLKKPLLPTLIVLAGPAWVLNMHHMMAERVMAGFLFPALWLYVKGVDEKNQQAFRGSAALACMAILAKYNGIFILAPVLAYGLLGGEPLPRLAGWGLTAISGASAWQAYSLFAGANPGLAALAVTSEAAAGFWSAPSHKARALLAFTGGCGVATSLWGAFLKPSRRVVLGGAAAAGVLFLPLFDLAPIVRGVDRATGFLLAWGVLVALAVLAKGRRTPGAPLWAAWLVAVAALQLAYWSVLARFIVFLLPPLTFWLAEKLEEKGSSQRLHAATLAVVLVLTLGLGVVDWTYAAAQRVAARRVVAEHPGRTIRTAAHWGLQEYLVAAGGKPLDHARGGWDEAAPGDVVVVTRANSNAQKPARPLAADVTGWTVTSPIPLRHISAWTGEGAFYSSVMGFLPWSLSREPVEEFTVVVPR